MTKDLKKVCAKELEKLMPNISPSDKTEAVDQKLVSRPTLDKYLNGDIAKIDTAMSLIKFFKKRIEERAKELAA